MPINHTYSLVTVITVMYVYNIRAPDIHGNAQFGKGRLPASVNDNCSYTT